MMGYPYIPGYSGHTSGTQEKVNRIVVHATVSPCVKGGARNVAHYFQEASAGGSAHYIVDPGEIVRCYSEGTICWHAPPNTGSVGVELCDPQAGPGSRWADSAHESMLALAAALVREVAGRWNVPLIKLGPADLLAGKRGICGHVDVANAWHRTDHGDPEEHGPFPWAHFMDLIKEEDVSAADVWGYEIPAPWDANDPKWQAGTHLKVLQTHVRAVEAKVDQMAADLAEIKALLSAPKE